MTKALYARPVIAAVCATRSWKWSCAPRRAKNASGRRRSLPALALFALLMHLSSGHALAVAASATALPQSGGIAQSGLLAFSPLYDVLDPSPLLARAAGDEAAYQKQSQYWDGKDESGNGRADGGAGEWTETGRNWTGLGFAGGAADFNSNSQWQGAGTSAVFSGAGGTVSVQGTQPFAALQFTSGVYLLQGGELLIAPYAGSSGNIDVADGLSATIGSGITGGGLIKTGAGELVLTGVNTYSGKTEIRQGTLVAGAPGSLASASVHELGGGALVLGGGHQSIGGLSGGEGTVDLGSAALAVTQSTDATFSGNLKGGAASRLTVLGSGELSLSNVAEFQGSFEIERGAALELAGQSSLALNNSLEGEGLLALKAGSATDSLGIGAQTGSGFSGVLEARRGELALDDNAEKALAAAGLRLMSGASASIDQNRAIRALELDGGELRYSASGDRPSAVLRVEDLAVSDNGAIIVFEPQTSPATTLAGLDRNFYDYAGTAALTLLVEADGAVSGSAEHITLLNTEGARLDSIGEADIEQKGGKAGRAVFGFGAELVADADQKGLYYRESLTGLEADAGKSIELDSDLSSSSSARLEAKLSGEGGFTFTGSRQAQVGNSLSSYTGPTLLEGGNLVFIADNAFGRTSSLQLDDQSAVDLNGHSQTVGGLSGSDGALILLGDSGKNAGALVVEQQTDSTYGGAIQGYGELEKSGPGRLTLSGKNTYSGDTNVRAGSLVIQGRLQNSSVTVRSGGSFGVFSGGRVDGDVKVNGGGALLAGNGGTIGGDLTMASNAVIAARSNNRALTVEGAVSLGEGLRLSLQGSSWTTGSYALLDAANASDLDGFSAIHVPGFMEEYSLVNDGGSLVLNYTQRTSDKLSDNERRIFNVLADLDKSGDMYQALSGIESAEFGSFLGMLSGEIHSSLRNTLFLVDKGFSRRLSNHISLASLSRRPILIDESSYMDPGDYDRFATSSGNYYGNNYRVWGTIGGTYGEVDSKHGAAKSSMQGPEVAAGLDALLGNGALLGGAIQYSYKDLDIDDRNSDADIHSYSLALYGGRELDVAGNVLRLLVGGNYSFHDIKTTRQIRVSAVRENLEADYNANSLRLYAEGAYSMVLAEKFHAEPFLNVGWNWLRTEKFNESGGQTALMGGSKPSDTFSSLLGLRLALPLHDVMRLNVSLGWEHVYGSLGPSLNLGFRQGGDSFGIKGNRLSRDELAVGIGAGLDLGDNLSLTINYDGSLGKDSETHGGAAMLIYSW